MGSVRHQHCRELPGVSASGLGYVSFPGIEQTINVWQGSTYVGAPDGTMARPFLTIGAAMLAAAALTPAAANRVLVLVWPGTYAETVTGVAYVDVVGIDRDSCLIDELEDAVGNTTYRTLTVDTTTISAAARVELFDSVLDIVAVTGSDARLWSSRITTSLTVSGAGVALVHGCEAIQLLTAGTASLTVESSTVATTGAVNALYVGGTGALDVRNTTLSSTQRSAIYLAAQPSSCTILSCQTTCAATYYAIDADAARTGLVVENVVMFVGGMHSRISHLKPERNVGSTGMRDWYGTIVEAFTACTFDGCTVRLLRDETATSTLDPPVNRTLIVDGCGRHRITRVGGYTIRLTLGGQKITLRDSELRMSLQLGSFNAGCSITIENSLVLGRVVLTQGPEASILRVVQSEVLAFDGIFRPVEYLSEGPYTYFERSRIKGLAHGTGSAVHWNTATNNNVHAKYSKFYHGNGAANDPMSRSGAQVPTFRSHQCAYNTIPGAGWLTNAVAAAQQHDTIDPGADY